MSKPDLKVIEGDKADLEIDLVNKIVKGEISGKEFVDLVKSKGELNDVDSIGVQLESSE